MKGLSAAVALAAYASLALAADIASIQLLTQGEFRLLSEDFGAALTYRSLIPSQSLGITSFDFGVGLTDTRLTNDAILGNASSADNVPSMLPVRSIRPHKGLPLNLDRSVAFAQVPGTNIRYYGGELRWAILPGSTRVPAVAVRGTLTKPTGVDQLDLATRSLDFSISQGIANITPYDGIGPVWVKRTPVGVPLLHGEDFN